MAEQHEGGCLCGRVRYAALTEPRHVTICHCKFCQRATGAAYMVEPIFGKDDVSLLAGAPRTFDVVSEGSGKVVHVHFCADCGTHIYASPVGDGPKTYNIRTGTITQRDALPPVMQIWHRSARPWLGDLDAIRAVEKQA